MWLVKIIVDVGATDATCYAPVATLSSANVVALASCLWTTAIGTPAVIMNATNATTSFAILMMVVVVVVVMMMVVAGKTACTCTTHAVP